MNGMSIPIAVDALAEVERMPLEEIQRVWRVADGYSIPQAANSGHIAAMLLRLVCAKSAQIVGNHLICKS